MKHIIHVKGAMGEGLTLGYINRALVENNLQSNFIRFYPAVNAEKLNDDDITVSMPKPLDASKLVEALRETDTTTVGYERVRVGKPTLTPQRAIDIAAERIKNATPNFGFRTSHYVNSGDVSIQQRIKIPGLFTMGFDDVKAPGPTLQEQIDAGTHLDTLISWPSCRGDQKISMTVEQMVTFMKALEERCGLSAPPPDVTRLLYMIGVWRNGCSCTERSLGGSGNPADCATCTAGLVDAIESHLRHPNREVIEPMATNPKPAAEVHAAATKVGGSVKLYMSYEHELDDRFLKVRRETWDELLETNRKLAERVEPTVVTNDRMRDILNALDRQALALDKRATSYENEHLSAEAGLLREARAVLAAGAPPSPTYVDQPDQWPKLTHGAQVGNAIFGVGVSSLSVVKAAGRLYERMHTPENDTARIGRSVLRQGRFRFPAPPEAEQAFSVVEDHIKNVGVPAGKDPLRMAFYAGVEYGEDDETSII